MRGAAPEPRACVVTAQGLSRAGAARAVLGQDGMLVLPEGEARFEWWSEAGAQGARKLSELALASVPKRAAVSALGEARFVVWVDERAQLQLVSWAGGEFGAPRVLAEGVDRRFTPALGAQGGLLLLAFTRSVGEAMHVMLARVEGQRSSVEDLTPPGHGASAPTFVAGTAPLSLVMVDAHAGVSPLLELPFDASGHVQPAIVRTPVSQPYAPPALAAARLSARRTVVAFTAIGRVAATAIGLVPLESAEAPVALVPSEGYGELALAVAHQPELAVFAVEAFRGSAKDAARKVLVGVVDAAGPGALLALGLEDASASAPSLRANAQRGEFSLAYATPKGIQRVELACRP